MILDGEVDYLPEPAFLNVGTIEEAIEKVNCLNRLTNKIRNHERTAFEYCIAGKRGL